MGMGPPHESSQSAACTDLESGMVLSLCTPPSGDVDPITPSQTLPPGSYSETTLPSFADELLVVEDALENIQFMFSSMVEQKATS